MDLKEVDILGDEIDRHWYYRAKAAALRRALSGHMPREILDIGAGAGFFSKTLLEQTSAWRATCVDTAYAEDRDEHIGDKIIAYRRGIPSHRADTVLLMDVLEHVEDELELLSPYVRPAPSGARFVVSVPAFQFLWSGHDVFLEHWRRYTIRSLRQVVIQSGLVPVFSCYFFGAVFPLAAASRLYERISQPGGPSQPRSQLRKLDRWTNAILYAMCAAELPFMKYNRLFGLSVISVFCKP